MRTITPAQRAALDQAAAARLQLQHLDAQGIGPGDPRWERAFSQQHRAVLRLSREIREIRKRNQQRNPTRTKRYKKPKVQPANPRRDPRTGRFTKR